MKHFLDKKFKHSTWFIEGRTVKYALDFFKNYPDAYLDYDIKWNKKISNYENICYIKCAGDKGGYRASADEIKYFLGGIK